MFHLILSFHQHAKLEFRALICVTLDTIEEKCSPKVFLAIAIVTVNNRFFLARAEVS